MIGVEALQLDRRSLVTVYLADGPCAGRHEQVAAWGAECWVRVGKPQRLGVDTQMWSRYDHNPLRRGEYVYSGITVDTETFRRALAAALRDGHQYGESYGA
jgi:hypothetical protein